MQKVPENSCQSCKKSDNFLEKYTSRAISPIYRCKSLSEEFCGTIIIGDDYVDVRDKFAVGLFSMRPLIAS